MVEGLGTDREFAALHGVRILAPGLREATATVLEAITERAAVAFSLLNSYSLALASRNDGYARMLTSGVNYADGLPLACFMAGGLSVGRRHRVRGPSLFEAVLKASSEHGVAHYFLGGTPGTLERLVARVQELYPDVQIAGTCSPPFRPLDPSDVWAVDEAIRLANADVVWVGLGTPRQDAEVRRLVAEHGIPAVAVGAAFAMTAGVLSPAPSAFQRWGMEWVYRFAQEPRRLWRRYTIENIRFLALILREACGIQASERNSL